MRGLLLFALLSSACGSSELEPREPCQHTPGRFQVVWNPVQTSCSTPAGADWHKPGLICMASEWCDPGDNRRIQTFDRKVGANKESWSCVTSIVDDDTIKLEDYAIVLGPVEGCSTMWKGTAFWVAGMEACQ